MKRLLLGNFLTVFFHHPSSWGQFESRRLSIDEWCQSRRRWNIWLSLLSHDSQLNHKNDEYWVVKNQQNDFYSLFMGKKRKKRKKTGNNRRPTTTVECGVKFRAVQVKQKSLGEAKRAHKIHSLQKLCVETIIIKNLNNQTNHYKTQASFQSFLIVE